MININYWNKTRGEIKKKKYCMEIIINEINIRQIKLIWLK